MDELRRLLARERQAEFERQAQRSRLAREGRAAAKARPGHATDAGRRVRRSAVCAHFRGGGGLRRTAASMSPGLSRELWLVEIGVFLNMLGYGAVLPFEIIYLHDGRGFSLGVAGLVVGVITGAAVVTSPVAGPLIDRFGARVTTAVAGVALAAGYA